MRHFALSLLLCGWCGIAFSCDQAESGPKEEPAESQWRNQSFTLATWNVAFDNPVPWDDRKAMAASVFDTQDFDIIGIQEPWRHALDDLIAMLPDYDHTGTSVTGNPADTDCHNNPIFYKKERFELLDSGSFWFSETPDIPGSKSWDSYGIRMCNWGKFRDRQTGGEFFLFNTHFDHKGEVAREKTAQIVNERVKSIAKGYHAFLTGDFNGDQWSEPYKILTDQFRDTRDEAVRTENADWHTYNAYNYSDKPLYSGAQLDHIMLRPADLDFVVNEWRIVNTDFNKVYPSDHFPIVLSFSFKFERQ